MSHFAVAVFLEDMKDLTKALAPFEELYGDSDEEKYIEFVKEDVKYIEGVKNEGLIADGYVQNDKGEWGMYKNPNSKWDWWMEGGRFGDAIRKKIKNVDFSISKEKEEEHSKFWDYVVNDIPYLKGEEKPFTIYKKQYYIERYKTKENYVYENSLKNITFAFLKPNGEWVEKGEMLMFGMSTDTKESGKKYIEQFLDFVNDEKNQELYMVLVDCHI